MSLVLFSLDQEATARNVINEPPMAVFSSIGDWRESEIKATGFVIDTATPLKGEAALKALRRIPETAIRPVFLLRSVGQDTDRMSDGIVQTLEEAADSVRSMARRLLDAKQHPLNRV